MNWGFSESDLEDAGLGYCRALGYETLFGSQIAPDGPAPERVSYGDVILRGRLEAALDRLNSDIPEDARADALKQVLASETPSLIEENRRLHKLLVQGAPVEFAGDDGSRRHEHVRLIDFDDPEANDWLAVNQFTVIEAGRNRRPDVVVFVNGLPLGVMELKNPGDENATVAGAISQLQTYKDQIPSLFRMNAILVASDGVKARAGSLTADKERFMPWRTVDGENISPKGWPELPTLIEGMYEKRRFLELIRDFTVFMTLGGGPVKVVAGYHQYHGVKKAVVSTIEATRPEGDRKVGVIWHTQGSGKSLLMAFYAGQLAQRPELENPTIVVITDRLDLDEQLFTTFSQCKDLIRQTPEQADSRANLRELLDRRASGGVIFTTMQKFDPEEGHSEYPMLTDRRNIIVIADEAHRSQYGFKARVNRKTGDVSYGMAKYLRDALPNASFIGFTGTPIERDDKSTPAVFGTYIDVYDISRAVEDEVTVPIYYESRLARIELPDEEKPKIDAEIEALTEEEALSESERLKQRWAAVESLVGARTRLKMVAQDLVRHFEARLDGLDGKGMVVCMSRRICVALHDEVIALRPDWHGEDDNAGKIKVVMTGSAADPQDWQRHIRTKAGRDRMAARAKDPEDSLKLVIVCDMWLTGFDAPPMHTMYLDKPLRGHNLMQAIARVNRVFRDKPAGLVVDYIGIFENLRNALRDYSPGDQEQVGIDEAQAVALMREKYEVVKAMFHGFDYSAALSGTPPERLQVIAEAIEWILGKQEEWAAQESDEERKKQARRRFSDAVLVLSKAYALASASEAAREIRDEVGFFQTVRGALVKSGEGAGTSAADRVMAVRQILDRAVASTEIVDILKAAGLKTPDLSILSEDFLAEVQQMKQKNLALEALKRLLNNEIRSRSRTNIVESRRFSERLEQAIARYHANAVSSMEVIQELINLAKDIREAHRRGEEEGLSPEELAFYDALAENKSAVEVMGNDSLKVIAHALLTRIKNDVTVDWQHRESARARMRRNVKRILRQHGYPPDLQEAAVQGVLRQAEHLAAQWAT